MSEKVKLPRDVAEAIEGFRDTFGTDELYEIGKYVGNETSESRAYTIFRWMTRGNMVKYKQAIVNGYEIEETPEDKVKDLFDYFGQEGVVFAGVDVQNKIANMFNLLNIKIKGVNT